jgi:hypothetical protein
VFLAGKAGENRRYLLPTRSGQPAEAAGCAEMLILGDYNPWAAFSRETVSRLPL